MKRKKPRLRGAIEWTINQPTEWAAPRNGALPKPGRLMLWLREQVVKAFGTINFGPGVAGRLITLVGWSLIPFGGLTLFTGWLLPYFLVALIIYVVVFVERILRYAEKNPQWSMTEGKDIVAIYKQQTSVSIDKIPEAARVANTAPPAILLEPAPTALPQYTEESKDA